MKKKFNYYKNKRIIISGASGYLGSYLLKEISKYSKITYGLSRKKKFKLGKKKILKLNLSKLKDVKKITNKFDIIFHLSGNTNLQKAEKNPKYNYNSNVKPIINLIKSAIYHKKKIKIIFASTGTIFGLTKNKNISENTNPFPVTVYDKHKLLAEKILKQYTKLKIIDSVSLRIQNIYGISESKTSDKTRGVLNQIIQNSVNGKSIKLFGSGNYYRDFLHISDLIYTLIFAGMSKKVNGLALNVGSNKSLKLKEVCKIIQKELLKSKNITVKIINAVWPKNHSPTDKRSYILNSTKFNKLTKWKQKIKINKGIKDTINFFDSKK